MEWEPIIHRIIRARLYSTIAKLTIVKCYAPTDDAADDEKDEFYSKLQEILTYIPKHDMTIVMGDLKAKVGSDNTGIEEYMGKHGLEEHRVTNKEISERTGIRPIVEEVKKRRWRWLGHVLRMSRSRHPLIALTWNPQGARKEDHRVPGGDQWKVKEWSQGRHGTSSIGSPRTEYVNGGSLWDPNPSRGLWII
ncbi:craniofacial development protein 2 [Elysia marginata]|uniref:Craniofacial development protein 2 n=1 Tax=Elysia marginata TaxID=1093978 RepID=A0AAV4HLM8_9GAST|nr:craniofacial development protein 2 [Elysia marginata]